MNKIFLLFLNAVIFCSSMVHAQYGVSPRPYAPASGYTPASGYDPATYGVQGCYVMQNPHSYACHAWTFAGNQEFPLIIIDWSRVIQGEWQTVTYANPWSDNDGPEFRMLFNPENPRIPEGVVNKNDNSMLGSLTFEGDKATWTNWRGKKLKTKVSEYAISDSYTFKFSFPEGDYYEQSFICRDFNRNSKHHLICSWFLIQWDSYYHTTYTSQHRGYFGFLKPSDLPPRK